MKNNKHILPSNLIERIKKDDSKAFKIIFDTYYKRLYAFSLNYVKDEYAAEEVVEEVFIKLWVKRIKLKNSINIKSYLYAMVRNASIDYLRKKKKTIRLDLSKHQKTSLMDKYILEEETHALLFEALDKLPEKSRKVFKLSCLEGLKYKEIAEDMQISINTVKSQRHRAIQLLKEHLKNLDYFMIILLFF